MYEDEAITRGYITPLPDKEPEPLPEPEPDDEIEEIEAKMQKPVRNKKLKPEKNKRG